MLQFLTTSSCCNKNRVRTVVYFLFDDIQQVTVSIVFNFHNIPTFIKKQKRTMKIVNILYFSIFSPMKFRPFDIVFFYKFSIIKILRISPETINMLINSITQQHPIKQQIIIGGKNITTFCKVWSKKLCAMF